MAVPTSIADLSSTLANNSPAGPDSIGTALDDYFRAGYGILKQMVSQGTDVASASTVTLPNDGHSFLVTGGTTITGIADSWVGRAAILRFSGTLQLTHNGSSFILPGSANISTAAGDFAMFLQTAAGVWRCAFYGRADGSALISNSFSGGTVANATTFQSGVTFQGDITANGRTVSPTELGYVDGVTDYIQTQLNAKQSTITGAATSIAGADLTASRALVSDASGKVAVSSLISTTELEYLDGLTGPLSTSLSAKAPLASPTFTGTVTIPGATSSADIELNNNDIIECKTVQFDTEYNVGTVTGNTTITLANGQKQKATLGNSTSAQLTISATGVDTGHFQLRLIQDATGSRAITWSGISSTQWLGSSSEPAINSAANGQTVVNIFVADGSIICASMSKVGAA
jgi:hypothetical protein